MASRAVRRPKEKAPALSGRGSAVSAGRGEGVADHRGGYGQNVRPALGFPKNSIGGLRGVPTSEAPRNAYRGASPTAAVAGDYLPSPTPFLLQIGDSEKPHRRRPARFPLRRRGRFAVRI